MRAICEACHLPQPTDWRAGDLCAHCGKAARAESRCFWCAKWTPEGKYCRHCGAETVEERLFGAARMLKDAGTDRFTVPKLLRELPADQIDNFTNIYQRHATVLARLVEDLLFLERHLFQKHWSIELEDRLISELPWPDEALAKYTLPPISPIGDLERAKEIHRTSPIRETRLLSAMVVLKLGLIGFTPPPPRWLGNYLPLTMAPKGDNLPPGKDLLTEICDGLYSGDSGIRDEAAFTLSHWRVLYSFGFPEGREGRRPILEALAEAKKQPEAVVGRALLYEEVEVPPETLDADDPDTAFAAAIATGHVERLKTAMEGDRIQRTAAGLKLIDLGVFAPLADTLRNGDPETQSHLLRAMRDLRGRRAIPELRDVFYELVESSTYESIVETASRLLSADSGNVDVLRVLRSVENNRSGLQSILQSDLSREDATAVGAYMVEKGLFRLSQFGVTDLATKGKVPDDFVPNQFPRADDETRSELCNFAEEQLKERGNEELHKFMLGVVFGSYSAKVREDAWISLRRLYQRQEHGSYGPLTLSEEPAKRFFGSMKSFLERLIEVMSDTETIKQMSYAELLCRLLKYHDEAVLPALVKEERLTMVLRDVVIEAMKNQELWIQLRTSLPDFLGLLAMHDEWLVDIFRTLQGFKGTDLEGSCTIVLDRLCREYEDLGEGEGRNPPPVAFDYREMFEVETDAPDWR